MKLPTVLKEAMKRGWYLYSQKNHYKWRHPNGGQVTTSKTPSDKRAFKNMARQFKLEEARFS